jgi:hypothetical protein
LESLLREYRRYWPDGSFRIISMPNRLDGWRQQLVDRATWAMPLLAKYRWRLCHPSFRAVGLKPRTRSQAFFSIRTAETKTTAPRIATRMLGMRPPLV